MKKPSCSAKRGERRENREIFLEKSPEFRVRTRQDEKKVDFTGQKTSACQSKIARKRNLKRGKARKTEMFGDEKEGWGRGEKMGFIADFAML